MLSWWSHSALLLNMLADAANLSQPGMRDLEVFLRLFLPGSRPPGVECWGFGLLFFERETWGKAEGGGLGRWTDWRGIICLPYGGDLRAWLSKAGNLVRNADPRPAPDYASESALTGHFHIQVWEAALVCSSSARGGSSFLWPCRVSTEVSEFKRESQVQVRWLSSSPHLRGLRCPMQAAATSCPGLLILKARLPWSSRG